MRCLLVLAPLALLAACGHPQSVVSPAGDEAGRLMSLLNLTLWVCGGVYVLVLAFLAAALWRNRRRLEAPPKTDVGDAGLRTGLVGWTVLITLGLMVLAGASFFAERSLAGRDADVLQIRATGAQWWWRLEYRDPGSGAWIETANELHLPQDRPVEIQLNATDVIHSFWIPTLNGKIDMIPGRTNHLRFTPRRAGWFRGQCAEFCGLQHAQMGLDVKVESPEAFAAWLARQARPAASSGSPRGEQIVSQGPCGQCHTVRGTDARGRAGPDLTHVGSRRFLAAGAAPRTVGAIMGWLAQPQAIKPGAEMPPSDLAPADALAVAEYLEGLK